MTTRKNKPPADILERVHLAECRQSAGYALIVDRWKSTVEKKRNDLENAQAADVRYVQGEIAGLRIAASTLETLDRELKQKEAELNRREARA